MACLLPVGYRRRAPLSADGTPMPPINRPGPSPRDALCGGPPGLNSRTDGFPLGLRKHPADTPTTAIPPFGELDDASPPHQWNLRRL